MEEKLYFDSCPFCSCPISFAKAQTERLDRCPVCKSPIKFEKNGENYSIASAVTGDSFEKDGFKVENGTLVSYSGSEKKVTIPQGVVAIAKECFKGNSSINEVIIPSGVLFVQESAFEGCEGIRKLTLPDGLLTLANCAFKNCRRLEKVSVPSSLRGAGYYVFYGCDNLTECIFPMDMEFLGGSPYAYCKKVKRANIPHCVTSASHWFCDNFSLEWVEIGRNLCYLTSSELPKLTTAIFHNASGWEVFKTVLFDDTVETIAPEVLENPKKSAHKIKQLYKEGKTIYAPSRPDRPYFFDATKL